MALVGSSAMRRSGSASRAAASATRRCWPPLMLPTVWLLSGTPTCSSICSARSLASQPPSASISAIELSIACHMAICTHAMLSPCSWLRSSPKSRYSSRGTEPQNLYYADPDKPSRRSAKSSICLVNWRLSCKLHRVGRNRELKIGLHLSRLCG